MCSNELCLIDNVEVRLYTCIPAAKDWESMDGLGEKLSSAVAKGKDAVGEQRFMPNSFYF